MEVTFYVQLEASRNSKGEVMNVRPTKVVDKDGTLYSSIGNPIYIEVSVEVPEQLFKPHKVVPLAVDSAAEEGVITIARDLAERH